jgi:hypothetical protein
VLVAGLNLRIVSEGGDSYATLALATGARLDVVSRQLGHASPTISADVSGHDLRSSRSFSADASTATSQVAPVRRVGESRACSVPKPHPPSRRDALRAVALNVKRCADEALSPSSLAARRARAGQRPAD